MTGDKDAARRERRREQRRRGHRRLRVLVLAVLAIAFLAGIALGVTDERPAASSGRSSRQGDGRSSKALTQASKAQSERWLGIGYDRSLKCDLVQKLSSAPELVVLGGSRAQRFEPSVIEDLTGLSAFNFAVQNCRPTDAYAISKYLFARSPSTKLHCLYAIQATSLVDAPMDQALLYDKRLSQWFPEDLLQSQKEALGEVENRRVPSGNVYSDRGAIEYNGYDKRLEQGVTFEKTMKGYLARMVPRAATSPTSGSGLSKFYLRKLLRLYNTHGVTPVLVIMPYHPEALSAFRAVGWQAKEDALNEYLSELHERYDFRVLDYLDIDSFGGSADWFYDGAHVTKDNASLILRQAVEDAPECFR